MCNLHTVCWGVVGCEWGETSAYFGITYVKLSLEYFLSFPLDPRTNIDFLFMSKTSFEGLKQNL